MNKLIPTNIITGFLGVGKTTAIMHLLKNKPTDEVWSVLVNEFGEIGIDGSMLKSVNAHVREVAGGCICCVAGLPMKMALNMMIATTKPDRIIIEPTGLGHPEEIINSLTGEYYDRVLDLRATVTLVDPRKLSESRYLENANFQDQIAVADVLVANKLDLCTDTELTTFNQFVAALNSPKQAVFKVAHGHLNREWLDYPRTHHLVNHPQHHQSNRLNPRRELYNSAIRLPEGQPFLRRAQDANGFYTCGWLFQPSIEFNFNELFGLLSGALCLRAKAVMQTNEGVFMFNAEEGVLSVNSLPLSPEDKLLDSRLEIIDDKPIDANEIERLLLSFQLNRNLLE